MIAMCGARLIAGEGGWLLQPLRADQYGNISAGGTAQRVSLERALEVGELLGVRGEVVAATERLMVEINDTARRLEEQAESGRRAAEQARRSRQAAQVLAVELRRLERRS